MRANEVAQLLAERVEDVARYLLPNGKRVGHYWQSGNVDDDKGQSLKICLSGEKQCVFSDFASGQSGDLLTLWSENRKISITEAISEASSYLGISHGVKRSPRSNLPPSVAFGKSTLIKNSSRAGSYLTETRKLSDEVVKKFGIREVADEIVFPYRRDSDFLNAKYLKIDRVNNKKQIRSEKNAQPCLFGFETLPPYKKEICITEGEIDAMSLAMYGIDAVSVPYGAGSGGKHAWIEYEFDQLKQFETIYLCFDMDEAGQVAAMEAARRLGLYRCRIVELPCKDANECLQQDYSKEEIKKCFANAKSFDPVELKSASVFSDDVIKRFNPTSSVNTGVVPPWDKAKGKILFRPAELSVWTGINGHGKSQFLGQIMLGAIDTGYRVCVASLELKPDLLLKRLTQQAAGIDNPSDDYIRAITDWYQDKLWVFDVVGIAKVDKLLEVFLYARQRYGIDMFVIDSFLKCGISEEDYGAQKQFVERLCDFKNEHNCHIHLIVHPRKGVDESRHPGKLDVKGTGSVTDLADNCFTIWRNKPKEEEIRKLQAKGEEFLASLKKPDCLWICDKQRNGDWEGRMAFWFDRKSYQYLEYHNVRPKRYVSYTALKT